MENTDENMNVVAIEGNDEWMADLHANEWHGEEAPETMQLERTVEVIDGAYCRSNKNGCIAISNFTMRIIEQIKSESAVSYQIAITDQAGRTVAAIFSHRDLMAVNAFNEKLALTGEGLFFSGKQSDLMQIKILMFEEGFSVRQAFDYVGIHWLNGGPVFLTNSGCIDQQGNPQSAFVLSDEADIRSQVLSVDPLNAEELKRIVGPLFSFNSLPVTATIMGYIGSCFIRPLLMKAGIKHGSLLMIGESGSGKSSTVDAVLRPLFGYDVPTSASDLTEASLRHAIASSNVIPFIIEEFKPIKIGKEKTNMLCNALRNTYDQTVSRKCGQSKSIIERQLRASMVIVGESQPSETAIRERCLQVVFSKDLITHKQEYTDKLRFLQMNSPLVGKLGRALAEEALSYDLKQLRAEHDGLMVRIAESLSAWPERIRNSFAYALLGLELLDRVCKKLGTTLAEQTGLTFSDVFGALETGIREYLLNGSDHNKSVVDEGLAVILGRMELEFGRDYKYLNGNTEIALDLHSVYDRFCEYIRKNRSGNPIEYLPQAQFEQQLRQNRVFKESRAVRFEGAKNAKRAVILDVAVLEVRIGNEVALLKPAQTPAA